MIKWEDDRERVLDKLDKIEEHMTSLRIRVYSISAFISLSITLVGILVKFVF